MQKTVDGFLDNRAALPLPGCMEAGMGIRESALLSAAMAKAVGTEVMRKIIPSKERLTLFSINSPIVPVCKLDFTCFRYE